MRQREGVAAGEVCWYGRPSFAARFSVLGTVRFRVTFPFFYVDR